MDEQKIPQPNLNEVAIASGRRDITRPWIELLLTTQDEILHEKGWNDLKIYDEVARDDQVYSCMQQRIATVVSCEWDVEPGGDRRIDQRAADFLRDQLNLVGWDDITEKMLWGRFYGLSVAECLWAREGNAIVLDDLRVRNRRRFRFDPEHRPRLITADNITTGEPLPPRKFWWFSTGGNNSDDPYGRGLAYYLYWLVFFKRSDIRLWLNWLEGLARGRRIGKYQPGTTKEEQSKLLKATAALGEDAAVIIPDGMLIEFIEMANATGDYAMLHERLNAAIAKIILSQTMTTENGSSRAQAEVHQNVAHAVIKADADLICNSFNRSVAQWLTDWNFPGAAYPKVWRRTEPEKDLKPVAERDSLLIQWGFQPKPEYIRETYGDNWMLPDGDSTDRISLNGAQIESLLQMLQLATQRQIPLAALPDLLLLSFPTMAPEQVQALVAKVQPTPQPSDQPSVFQTPEQPTEDQSAEDGTAPAFSERKDNRDTVSQFTDRLSSSLRPQFGEIWGELRTMLNDSSDLVTFREKLDEAYPNLDSETLTALMGEAMASARLAGIYEAQEGQ